MAEADNPVDVDALQQEVDRLRTALAAATNGQQQQQPQMTKIVLPPPVRLPLYAGKEEPEIWIEKAKRALCSQELEGQNAVYFLRDYLTGSADDEIRHRNPTTSQEVFDSLKSVFGQKRSRPQILRDFYNRIQKSQETVTEYSHALVTTIDKMGLESAEREKCLKEQFIEGVRPLSVQRFLKRRNRDRDNLSFFDLRKLALEECEDSPGSKAQVSEQLVDVQQSSLSNTSNEQMPQWALELITLTKQLVQSQTTLTNTDN